MSVESNSCFPFNSMDTETETRLVKGNNHYRTNCLFLFNLLWVSVSQLSPVGFFLHTHTHTHWSRLAHTTTQIVICSAAVVTKTLTHVSWIIKVKSTVENRGNGGTGNAQLRRDDCPCHAMTNWLRPTSLCRDCTNEQVKPAHLILAFI